MRFILVELVSFLLQIPGPQDSIVVQEADEILTE